MVPRRCIGNDGDGRCNGYGDDNGDGDGRCDGDATSTVVMDSTRVMVINGATAMQRRGRHDGNAAAA
jgi:hypothetical protein